MNDALNQKISQFLDDELDHNESLSLLQKMQSEPELGSTLNRYEAISHALKTDVFLTISPDFLTKISQEIEHEPVYLLPKIKPKTITRNHKLLALAASIAIVGVFAERNINQTVEEPFKASSALQVAQQQPSQTPETTAATDLIDQTPLNARINDYLQAHNNSVYNNGELDKFRPLTRVTAYQQE